MISLPRQHTHVFVDGPNIDMVLGTAVLSRRPKPGERPRWDRVRSALRCANPELVLNGNRFPEGGALLWAFRRAMRSHGYRVPCPSGSAGDPVDAYIRGKLIAIARLNRPCSVALVSHDGGYAPYLAKILTLNFKVSVVGFYEEMAPELLQLRDLGAEVLDLEHSLGAFDVILPRPPLSRQLVVVSCG